jgi:GT2 family glycosyltransferase
LFLDDDCLLTTNLISAYARAMERWPEVAVLEGAIAAVGPRPSGLHHAPLNGSGGYLWSCNFMIRRELFEQLGGFDERFPFAALEDCELMERLGTDGQVVRFVADATVAHPWRQGRAIDIWRQFVSHALLADKHPAFVRRWSPVNLLRMLWGRVWLYRGGRFRTIGVAQWPLVALDLASPLLHCAAVRLPVLRRGLVRQAARSRTAARSSGSEPHHSGQHPA